jgi:hypothetical protein
MVVFFSSKGKQKITTAAIVAQYLRQAVTAVLNIKMSDKELSMVLPFYPSHSY